MHRPQSKPHSLFDGIEEQKQVVEAEIVRTEPGPARKALYRKVRQLDTAAHIAEWLSSPGLQAPR